MLASDVWIEKLAISSHDEDAYNSVDPLSSEDVRRRRRRLPLVHRLPAGGDL